MEKVKLDGPVLTALFEGQTKVVDKDRHLELARKMHLIDLIKQLTMPALKSMKEAVLALKNQKIQLIRIPSKVSHIILDFMIENQKKFKKILEKKDVPEHIKVEITAYLKECKDLKPEVIVTEEMIEKHFALLFALKDMLTPPNQEIAASGSETSILQNESGEISELNEKIIRLELENVQLILDRVQLINDNNLEIIRLLKSLNELENTMKKAFQIFLNVITFGIHFYFKRRQKTDLLKELEIYEKKERNLITNQTSRAIAEEPPREESELEVEVVINSTAHLNHTTYAASEENKVLVELFSKIVSKNKTVDLFDAKFTYANNRSTLEDEKNKKILKENSYMFMVQGVKSELIDNNINIFKKLFLDKKLKYYGLTDITMFNVETIVPQIVLLGNEDKARDFFLARAAKANNFLNCDPDEKSKYQVILEQVAYFDVEEYMDAYYQVVHVPLKDMLLERITTKMVGKQVTQEMVGGMVTQAMVGEKITKEMVAACKKYDNTVGVVTELMIEAGATLLLACLTKVNEVLDGDDEVKAAALERVRVGRIRIDETKDAGE